VQHTHCTQNTNYLCRRLASEGIVSVCHAVVLYCVCLRTRYISLGSKGNVLYPVLSSFYDVLLKNYR